MSIENLEDSPISPPTSSRLPGPPKKKRAHCGERGIAALEYTYQIHGEVVVEECRQHCGTCGNLEGHNARPCTIGYE